jgi:hypothetical protein
MLFELFTCSGLPDCVYEHVDERAEVFTAMKFKVVVFWVDSLS